MIMASKKEANFFNHFAPLVRNGHLVRTDGDLIMFIRLRDKKYVGFREDQIDMKALEKYISRVTPAETLSNVEFNMNDQASLDLGLVGLKHSETGAPSAGNQQSNLVLPQSSAPKQSQVVDSTSTMMHIQMQGLQEEEFDHMQLSLSDMTQEVKSFISGLNLDQDSLEQPTAHQLSPSSDRDLQSLADLVSSTLDAQEPERMQVDFCQTQMAQQQHQPQQQQQLERPKSPDNLGITLSPLGQPTFHLNMDKAASQLLIHPHTSSASTTPHTQTFAQQQHQHHQHRDHQQSSQHQRLAPIQTLLSSLRQKDRQQGTEYRPRPSSFATSNQDLTLEPNPALQFSVSSQDSPQKPAGNREIESFFKSVAIHFENDQNRLMHENERDLSMGVVQVDKKDQRQHCLQVKQFQSSSQLLPKIKDPPEKNTMPSTSMQPNEQLGFLKKACPESSTVTNVTVFGSNDTYGPESHLIHRGQKNLLPSTDLLGVDSRGLSLTTNSSSIAALTVDSNSGRLSARAMDRDINSSPAFLNGLALEQPKSNNRPAGKVGSDLTVISVNPQPHTAQSCPISNVTVSCDKNTFSSSISGATIIPHQKSFPEDQMWTNVKTPHASLVDKKATQALIQLVKRPGIPLRLATLKIKKKDVWNEIGLEMKKQGFLLRNPGEQCSQKWSDLVQTFKDYETRRDLPGLNHMKQPDFYSELCEILKDKQGYKIQPQQLKKLPDNYILLESSGIPTHTQGITVKPTWVDEEDPTKTLMVEYMETSRSKNVQDKDTPAACYTTTKSSSVSSSAVSTNVSHATFKTAALMDGSGIAADEQLSASANSLLPSSTSPSTTAFNAIQTFSSKSPVVSASCACERPLSSPPAVSEDRPVSRMESLEATVKSLQELVQTQNKEIERMSDVLSSVQTLLKEQRRDSELVRGESGRRFTELKALIGQNQREKMKFMYDFLKAIKPSRQPKRLKPQANTGGKKPS